jgi:hypothetical protein
MNSPLWLQVRRRYGPPGLWNVVHQICERCERSGAMPVHLYMRDLDPLYLCPECERQLRFRLETCRWRLQEQMDWRELIRAYGPE